MVLETVWLQGSLQPWETRFTGDVFVGSSRYYNCLSGQEAKKWARLVQDILYICFYVNKAILWCLHIIEATGQLNLGPKEQANKAVLMICLLKRNLTRFLTVRYSSGAAKAPPGGKCGIPPKALYFQGCSCALWTQGGDRLPFEFMS